MKKKVARTIAFYDTRSADYADKIKHWAPIPEINKLAKLVGGDLYL